MLTGDVTTAVPADGTATRLRDLAALREQGILTEEEFQREKAKLLGG